MDDQIKSGREILESFFSSIKKIKNVDPDIADIIIKLYKESKLTSINLSNELYALKPKKQND